MKIQDVVSRVSAISLLKSDDEAAHVKEDELYVDVLRAISEGVEDAPQLAFEALQTLEISFSRWCA